jgi:hypothetical protein
MRLLNYLPIGRIEDYLSHWRIFSRRGLGVEGFFLDDIWLVDEADDPHLSRHFGHVSGSVFIELSDEVGPALS